MRRLWSFCRTTQHYHVSNTSPHDSYEVLRYLQGRWSFKRPSENIIHAQCHYPSVAVEPYPYYINLMVQ